MILVQSVEAIQEIVRTHACVHPVGGGSKPALSAELPLPPNTTPFSTRKLNQILEYEPNEYTITAQAGTPIQTLNAALAENGQYLPFDPLLAAAGATIGGTVAANTSGSGRFRYGGVRDFILGVRFVDGFGRIVRGGGKVVKNASGFDLPKFMVGSLGRYGILTEVTVKVFPRPAAYRTLHLTYRTLQDALNATFALSNQPFEIDALDFRPKSTAETDLWLRVGGLADSLPARVERLANWLRDHATPTAIAELEDEQAHWDAINRIAWAAPAATLVKIPVPPKQLMQLSQLAAIQNAHYSAAGNVAWITTDTPDRLDEALQHLKLSGLVVRGNASRIMLGNQSWLPLARRVKTALDPHHKFLGIATD